MSLYVGSQRDLSWREWAQNVEIECVRLQRDVHALQRDVQEWQLMYARLLQHLNLTLVVPNCEPVLMTKEAPK